MSDDKIKSATFQATFPGTQSAIAMHGEGGMRIQLDIPENEMAEAASLILWRGRGLTVTIKPNPKGKAIGSSGSKDDWD